MDNDALMVAQTAQFVGFNFVLLGFGVVNVASACIKTSRALLDALFAQKICGLDCIAFVGGSEDEAVAEIQP